MKETIDLIRPVWNFEKAHKDQWVKNSITVVICERDTEDILKLCLESLLRFYPDIQVLIVEGGSVDDSLNYVRYKATTTPNVKVWERNGRNGHGTMLDDAIRAFVTTKYVLLMDSDVIVHRGGWIEWMLLRMDTENIYALGSLMKVTNSGDACGEPKDENDILVYAHPSCSIIRRETYLTLKPFVEHGAPLVYNMQDAQKQGFKVLYFPIDMYVSHLSGASWTEPKTIWKDDADVRLRPFVTFVADPVSEIGFLYHQANHDFDIVISGQPVETKVVIHAEAFKADHNMEFDVRNSLYSLRFKVHGEYVCYLGGEQTASLDSNYVNAAKQFIISTGCPDEAMIGNLKFIKRKVWQSRECLS